jgi:hypothetical protein
VAHRSVKIPEIATFGRKHFAAPEFTAQFYQSPLPERETVCLPDEVLSVIVSVAENEFFEAGLNVTVIVQCEPAVSEDPQLFVCEKSAVFEPVIAMFEIFRVVVPVFVSVTGFVVLEPDFSVPKLKLVGLTDAPGFITVAVIGTICGLPDALSATTRFAA